MSININSSSFPSSNGGGVQTSQYTAGTTINGQGYALIFPLIVSIQRDANSPYPPVVQNETSIIYVTIDGQSAEYIGYRLYQGRTTTSNAIAWAELSQGGPETFMFTRSFYATGSFQKIIIYLYT